MEIIEEAAKLLVREGTFIDPEFANEVVLFNWNRGIRNLDDLISLEQFANAYSDAEM